MQYSQQLNQAQDVTIGCISEIRDFIQQAFDNHIDKKRSFGSVLWNLTKYQADRSQAVSHLVSMNMPWDAEIILRSFYEANVKIWYLCSVPEENREHTLIDFISAYQDVYSRKRHRKAINASQTSLKMGKGFDSMVFDFLADPKSFPWHDGNKKERKAVEQRWSFSELVKTLHSMDAGKLDFKDIKALEITYANQSHLIHSDSIALNFMIDRATRKHEELEALHAAHICRIFTDQVSLWAMSCKALWSLDSTCFKFGETILKGLEKLHDITQPLSENFESSQTDFYKSLQQNSGIISD